MLDRARSLERAAANGQAAIAGAEQPFTEAAALVETAARGLDKATSVLRETSEDLRLVMSEVNWLSLVADGLRTADRDHVPNPVDEPPAPASDLFPEPTERSP